MFRNDDRKKPKKQTSRPCVGRPVVPDECVLWLLHQGEDLQTDRVVAAASQPVASAVVEDATFCEPANGALDEPFRDALCVADHAAHPVDDDRHRQRCTFSLHDLEHSGDSLGDGFRLIGEVRL